MFSDDCHRKKDGYPVRFFFIYHNLQGNRPLHKTVISLESCENSVILLEFYKSPTR